MVKRYYVPTSQEYIERSRFGGAAGHFFVIRDRKNGNNRVKDAHYMTRRLARTIKDKLNAQEAALPGGQNKRLKS